MKLRSLATFCLIFAAILGILSVGASAATNSSQVSTSISFTVTTTTSLPMESGGSVQVSFDSVQLTTTPPQAYSFGVVAKTTPGLWITRLVWQFGDGSMLDVPYCCQSQVSEVQYHAYSKEGSYPVLVAAYDSAGKVGVVMVTVNWTTPIPEYPNYGVPLLASMMIVVVGLAALRMGSRRGFFTPNASLVN